MPTVQTQGFQVQERPRVDFADPRLLVPNLSGILPAAQQGLGMYGNLQAIADDARARPIRQRLQDISLVNAENALALSPLENARRRTVLQQPIERVLGGGLEEVQRYPLQPMLDEEGKPVFDSSGNPRMERPAGSDVFSTELVEVVDPVSGQAHTVTRRGKPTQTLEQAALAADQADYRDQLAAIRAQNAATAAAAAETRGENDRIKADAMAARAEAALNDPKWRTVSSGEDAAGNLVINQVDADGQLRTIPTGQKKRSSNFFFGGVKIDGSGGVSGAPAGAIGPEVTALLNQMGGAKPAVAIATNTITPAGQVATLTVDQARVARPGTIFLGIDGRKRQKNADGTVSIIQ